MKLDNIIAVSGFPGLHKLLATRSNGLLIESFENGKRQFVSGRKHQFTPLVSIGIYTYTDVESLDEVLKKLHNTESTTPLPDPNDKAEDLRAWFKQIVPDHDEDRVHINDIRKLIKWYLFLKQYAWEQINVEVEKPKIEDEEKKEVKKTSAKEPKAKEEVNRDEEKAKEKAKEKVTEKVEGKIKAKEPKAEDKGPKVKVQEPKAKDKGKKEVEAKKPMDKPKEKPKEKVVKKEAPKAKGSPKKK